MFKMRDALKPFVDWRSGDFQSGFLVKVDQALIDLGCKGNSSNCPIALALTKKFGGFGNVSLVSVSQTRAEIDYRGTNGTRYILRVALSREATRFVQRFDSGQQTKEFTFLASPIRITDAYGHDYYN